MKAQRWGVLKKAVKSYLTPQIDEEMQQVQGKRRIEE